MQPWFLVIPFAIVAALLWWLYRRLIVQPGWGGRGVRFAGAGVLLALTVVAFTGVSGGPPWLPAPIARGYAWVGTVWLALAWYLILALIPVALVSLGTRLMRRTDTPQTRVRVNRVGAPLAVLGALLVTGYGLVAAASPTFTPRTITDAELPPAFDGITVAVVTDLHVGPVRGAAFTRDVVQQVNDAKPDLVLLVGDVIDGPQSRFGEAIDPLAQLRAPLGVVAVTGNHEMYSGTVPQWLEEWRALGVEVLANRDMTLTRGSDQITLVGLHDVTGTAPYAADFSVVRDTPDGFTLLLAHQPIAAQDVQGAGVDLQVSGHTHGGQLWPFRALVPLQQPVIDGFHLVGDVPVLTSRGAGAWGPPVRVGANPEIPLITLRRG